jgi:hypothetical protein
VIVSIQLRPVLGSNLTINDDAYPVHGWEPEPDMPDNTYKKMQQTGEWPSFAYPGSMKLAVEGHVLGVGATDALRAASVMDRRQALIDACMPNIDSVHTSRKHGVLRVEYDGWGETADGDYHCVAIHSPISALQGANIPFFFTLKIFTPYVVGVSTTKYFL